LAFKPLQWLDAATTLRRLWELEKKHNQILEAQASEIQNLKDRMTRLEEHLKAREEVLIVKAEAAAGVAASMAAINNVAEISGRLSRLEAALDLSAPRRRKRLAPPDRE
jgi:hypothetical protein